MPRLFAQFELSGSIGAEWGQDAKMVMVQQLTLSFRSIPQKSVSDITEDVHLCKHTYLNSENQIFN